MTDTYDRKCHELADDWLIDERVYDRDRNHRLAIVIQKAIEEWMDENPPISIHSIPETWATSENPRWMLDQIGRTSPNTPEHRGRVAKLAIRIVLAIPGIQPIAEWDSWAARYLRGQAREDRTALEATAWAAQALVRAESLAADAIAVALIRETYPMCSSWTVLE